MIYDVFFRSSRPKCRFAELQLIERFNKSRVKIATHMHPTLSTWLYTSICKLDRGDSRDEVQSIVDISRSRNLSLDVTGALIWAGNRFAQFLEGPHTGIAALRESIERDARHRNILTLNASEAATRTFDGWSLAYSGTATFVEREINRISDQTATRRCDGARELKRLLLEFGTAS